MSPEQARGSDVDGRSDIFSLGIVLYELLTGRAPFEGVTATDMLLAILQNDPIPVTQLRPDTSPGLARIVRMCLEKDRMQRYVSASALAADLHALTRSPTVTTQSPSIAVLPFVNLSPDPQNEYFADEWLERAFREGDGILPMMNYAIPAGPLRRDPRFGSIMRRVGLVPAPDIPAS